MIFLYIINSYYRNKFGKLYFLYYKFILVKINILVKIFHKMNSKNAKIYFYSHDFVSSSKI